MHSTQINASSGIDSSWLLISTAVNRGDMLVKTNTGQVPIKDIQCEFNFERMWLYNNCFDELPKNAKPTGETLADSRKVYTRVDANGNAIKNYEGLEGCWYDLNKYSLTYSLTAPKTSQLIVNGLDSHEIQQAKTIVEFKVGVFEGAPTRN